MYPKYLTFSSLLMCNFLNCPSNSFARKLSLMELIRLIACGRMEVSSLSCNGGYIIKSLPLRGNRQQTVCMPYFIISCNVILS